MDDSGRVRYPFPPGGYRRRLDRAAAVAAAVGDALRTLQRHPRGVTWARVENAEVYIVKAVSLLRDAEMMLRPIGKGGKP